MNRGNLIKLCAFSIALVFVGLSYSPKTFANPVKSPHDLLGKTITVYASYYGGCDGLRGRTTASCTIFNEYEKTAAHKTLPLGTKVILKNPKTGSSELVTITDRGPYVKGRDIDVAKEGVGKPLDVSNKTPLLMRVVFIPKKPLMGDACVEDKHQKF